ncbi:MAG: transposase, partial [Firmicutes bacterium]|nr:transposase [Candidatus Colivicinus equi]
TRVSNGPIEGRNSLIKKILKIANGYSNFKRFRNRVIYCLNTLAKHNFISQ